MGAPGRRMLCILSLRPHRPWCFGTKPSTDTHHFKKHTLSPNPTSLIPAILGVEKLGPRGLSYVPKATQLVRTRAKGFYSKASIEKKHKNKTTTRTTNHSGRALRISCPKHSWRLLDHEPLSLSGKQPFLIGFYDTISLSIFLQGTQNSPPLLHSGLMTISQNSAECSNFGVYWIPIYSASFAKWICR